MANETSLEMKSLPEFFKDEVNLSLESLSIDLSDEAEFYIVNLLTHFSLTDKLYQSNASGQLEDKALAVQLLEALLEKNPHQRIPILKKMGDVALYTSGFFSESIERAMLDLDYYMQMGHTAYSSLSQLTSEQTQASMGELFDELACNFANLVDVLNDISEKTNYQSDQSLLKLYDRWLATGSEKSRKALEAKGILVTDAHQSKYTQ